MADLFSYRPECECGALSRVWEFMRTFDGSTGSALAAAKQVHSPRAAPAVLGKVVILNRVFALFNRAQVSEKSRSAAGFAFVDADPVRSLTAKNQSHGALSDS